MNESKILRCICKPSWYAHAYGEYLSDVAESYHKLIEFINDLIMEDELISGSINEMLTEAGISPNARIIIGDNIQPEVQRMCKWLHEYYYDGRKDIYFSLKQYTPEECLSDLNMTYMQTVLAAKSFLAFENESFSIPDRVTSFLQDVQSEFGDLGSDLKPTLSYYRSMILNASDVNAYSKSFLDSIGINSASTDDNYNYLSCDMADYTGNTPGLALDFSGVKQAASTTISICATAVKGVFSAIKAGTSWLFKKTTKYVNDVIIDPAVAQYIGKGEGASGEMNGLAWMGPSSMSNSWHLTSWRHLSVNSRPWEDEANRTASDGGWLKIDTVFGEILYQLRATTSEYGPVFYFKPVAMDYKYLFQNGFNYATLGKRGDLAPTNFGEQLEWFTSDLYQLIDYVKPLNKDADKYDLFIGYKCSLLMLGLCSHYALGEMLGLVGVIPALTLSNSAFESETNYFDRRVWELNSVTNADLFSICAGYREPDEITWYQPVERTLSLSPTNRIYEDVQNRSLYLRSIVYNIMFCYALARYDRKNNPYNYVFVPFSNNKSSFNDPDWELFTDQEIADRRDNFVAKAILCVVAVVAITFVGVTARKLLRRRVFKKKQFIGMMDNKMWNGEKLSNKEMKKYVKYTKKLSGASILNPAFLKDFSETQNPDFTTLLATIVGESIESTN